MQFPLAAFQAAASNDGGENQPGRGQASWQELKTAGSDTAGKWRQKDGSGVGILGALPALDR